jgi:hypothetical protein
MVVGTDQRPWKQPRRREMHMNKKVLLIVENLPVPFDRRVWKEAGVAA